MILGSDIGWHMLIESDDSKEVKYCKFEVRFSDLMMIFQLSFWPVHDRVRPSYLHLQVRLACWKPSI